MDLLVFLASLDGRVATRREIFDTVWDGEFVAESVLGRSVADLRRLLDDSAVTPLFVETIPKRGYRLVAPVRLAPAAKSSANAASVAVLPFVDLAPSESWPYLADAFVEELTCGLGNVPGLRVTARTSAAAFRDKPIDVRDIARRLGVRTVIEGSVQHTGDALRVTVQLIDGADGCHIWSRRFDHAAANIFAAQDEIARAIVAELNVKQRPPDRPTGAPRGTTNADAHALYVQGRYICARRSPAAMMEAKHCFEQAVELDPGFALAHASIAECLGINAFMGELPPRLSFPQAIRAARRSLEIDSDLAEGHAILATLLMLHAWQWAEAECAFRRAIELRPSYALAHMWYSHLLSALGRAREAMEEAEAAAELDPLSLTVRASIGLRLYESDRIDAALATWQSIVAMEPDFAFAHFHLGRACLALGRFDEALSHLDKAAGFTLTRGFAGAALAGAGRRDEARAVLEELHRLSDKRYVASAAFALVHQGLGDVDAAVRLYRQALDAHESDLVFAAVDPVFDAVRGHPAFAAGLRRAFPQLRGAGSAPPTLAER